MPDVIVVPRTAPGAIAAPAVFRSRAALPGPRIIDAEFTTDAPRPVGPEIRLHPERVVVVEEPKKKKEKKKKEKPAPPPPAPKSNFAKGVGCGLLGYFVLSFIGIIGFFVYITGTKLVNLICINGCDDPPPWKGPDAVMQASLPVAHAQPAPMPQPPAPTRIAHKAPVRHK